MLQLSSVTKRQANELTACRNSLPFRNIVANQHAKRSQGKPAAKRTLEKLSFAIMEERDDLHARKLPPYALSDPAKIGPVDENLLNLRLPD
jgi:hypothetical protein